jgi:hypothetical protein
MAPHEVPKPRIEIHYIDPMTGEVEVVHYPREDGKRNSDDQPNHT